MEEKELKLGIVNSVTNSWKLIFWYFGKFLIPFLYPASGTLIGALVILFSYNKITKLLGNIPALVAFLVLLLIGIVLLCHAIWRNFIAIAATNLVTKNLILNNEFFNYREQNKVIEKRGLNYLRLLLLIMLICFVIPFMMIISIITFKLKGVGIAAIVLSIYLHISLMLSIPFFTFNETMTSFDCIKSSFKLINKNMLPTIGLILLYSITLIALMNLLRDIGFIPYIGDIIGFILSIIVVPLNVLITVHWYLKLTNEEKPA